MGKLEQTLITEITRLRPGEILSSFMNGYDVKRTAIGWELSGPGRGCYVNVQNPKEALHIMRTYY